MMEWLDSMNVEKMSLHVRDDRVVARILYEKCGFEEVRVRDNYYKRGIHAILMVAKKSTSYWELILYIVNYTYMDETALFFSKINLIKDR